MNRRDPPRLISAILHWLTPTVGLAGYTISQATKNTITLKGSTEIVTEFFGYSINSILYQVASRVSAKLQAPRKMRGRTCRRIWWGRGNVPRAS